MIDVSIFLPGIRTHFWQKFFDTAVKACQSNSFEIVVVSPFDPPESLKNETRFKVIRDYGSPTRCAQIAAINSAGRLLYHCVDDGFFFLRSIDASVDLYDKQCSQFDMINMRYREGQNFTGGQLPLSFWTAGSSQELRLPGIDPLWRTALHFLISKERFVALGGFDCQFEYLNHPLHDFAFRLQASGGRIIHSPIEVLCCTHYPDETVDHGPVHTAQLFHDAPIFSKIYQDKNAASMRQDIGLENWRNSPAVWERRFSDKKIPVSYEELLR